MACLELVDDGLEVFEAPKIQVVAVGGVGGDEEVLEVFGIEPSFDDLAIEVNLLLV